MDKILPAITYIYHHTLLRITILFTLLFGLAGEGWGQITLHSITPEERCGAGAENVTATFSSTKTGKRTYYAEYLSGTTWTPFASGKFLTPTNETLTGTINLPVDSYNIRIRHTSGNTVYESNYLLKFPTYMMPNNWAC